MPKNQQRQRAAGEKNEEEAHEEGNCDNIFYVSS